MLRHYHKLQIVCFRGRDDLLERPRTVPAEKRVNVNYAFVFDERTVLLRRCAFSVETLDRGVEVSEFVAAIGKRDLRK